MTNINEKSQKNHVEDASQNIAKLNTTPLIESHPLKLPSKCYGSFCLKILKEFIDHHNLDKNLPLPDSNDQTHVALSKIFDVMLHSMGKEKREEFILNSNEYNMSLPACLRE